jgi:hypothetical protein
MSTQLDRIEEKVDKIDEFLRGPNGVNVRLAKVEQTSKWQSFLARSFIGAAIIALVSGLAQKCGFGGGGQ